ncbi:MAG: hypothetical protein JOY64_22110 [Alphaproteobacteria bacterium]|nr:hypothetical protein [Alphaproteobacteria bacterium]
MKRPLTVSSLLLLSLAAPAAAQDKPLSLMGTWLVTGQSVGLGESLHPEHTNREVEPKVHRVNLRFVFEKQEGNNFWGTSTGPSGTAERILGAIARDNKTGVLINARGNQQQFTVLDANTIEGCYASQGPKYISAACTIWTRQP